MAKQHLGVKNPNILKTQSIARATSILATVWRGNFPNQNHRHRIKKRRKKTNDKKMKRVTIGPGANVDIAGTQVNGIVTLTTARMCVVIRRWQTAIICFFLNPKKTEKKKRSASQKS